MSDDLDALLLAQMREDFLVESQEILHRLDPLLVQLEKSSDTDLINTIFREMHTLKGTASFIGFDSIEHLAHKLEDVFGAVRDHKLTVTSELIDAAFAGTQLLTTIRADIQAGKTGNVDISSVVPLLENILAEQTKQPKPKQTPSPAKTNPDSLHTTTSQTETSQTETSQTETSNEQASTETSTETSNQESPIINTETSANASFFEAPFFDTEETAPLPHNTSRSEGTLRVKVETIDNILELVSELITTRNALLTIAEETYDETLLHNATTIDRLTRQLYTAVTTIRLVPIERLFSRFSGVVRNLARECGKKVKLVIKGGDTPVDRTISERIHDPMIHLLRNAIDHGLETAEERRLLGKPEEGIITVAAERQGDRVILHVSDDGAGIDPVQVRFKAIEKGLYTPEEAAALTDKQAVQLIFTPSFSTASKVTDLSGRGVGLDIIVRNVRQLRGTVSVDTVVGQGTTFIIQLPLTLAILQVQLVRVGQYIYALPLHIVRETVWISPDEIQTMQHDKVVNVHETLLSVRHLNDWLNNPYKPPNNQELTPSVVVRRPDGDEVLLVDELVSKQQVVIKPLSPYLGKVSGVEGTAILPDGSVTLILDIEGLANPNLERRI